MKDIFCAGAGTGAIADHAGHRQGQDQDPSTDHHGDGAAARVSSMVAMCPASDRKFRVLDLVRGHCLHMQIGSGASGL